MIPSRRQGAKVTIRDVARESGVSIQTVSRVLNNRPDVSTQTRQRVQDTINRLDFHPSALARSLIQQRSHLLGVVIADLKYVGISLTLNGIIEKAEACGYTILVKELSRFNPYGLRPALRSLLAHEVHGIIHAVPEWGENWKHIQPQLPDDGPPLVFLKCRPHALFPTLAVDNYTGAQLVTQHLLEHGRRRIAFISGPLEWWEAAQRKKGWADALESADLPVLDRQWSIGNWSTPGGESAFHVVLENYPQMDAVFAANDQMALAVLHVARQKGIRVPEDLAVVGFDDLPESAYFNPPLTTVRQSLRTLGHQAVVKLLQLAGDPIQLAQPELPQTIVLQPELIVRSSSIIHPNPI